MIKYTVKDYERFSYKGSGDYLWELMNGVLQMSPPPLLIHQRISRKLVSRFDNNFNEHGVDCEIFQDPTDVKLGEHIVKPDIFIICDKSKLTKSRCEGIPDLVVEILSQKTKKNDLPNGTKFLIYEEFGLKEYWIVNPLKESNITLTQFILVDNELVQKHIYKRDSIVQSYIFNHLSVKLSDIF